MAVFSCMGTEHLRHQLNHLFDNTFEGDISNAFNGLQSSAMFKQKMLRATQVPMQEFIVCDLRFRHLKVWREADFSCPRAVNKKAVTYHKWCGSSESGPRGSPFLYPLLLVVQGFGQTCVEEFQQVQIACTPFESGVLQMAWWF